MGRGAADPDDPTTESAATPPAAARTAAPATTRKRWRPPERRTAWESIDDFLFIRMYSLSVVFCFVHRPRAKRDPLFGWRGGLRTAKSEGVERRRRAHRLTADGLWDGRLPGATRSSATRSEEQAKEQLPAGASRARRDVADVTGDVGSRSLVLATLKRRTTRGSTTAARAAVVTYEEPDAIRPRRCGGALVRDAGGR